MDSDWVEVASEDEANAHFQRAQAETRAEEHAWADELMNGLELEAKQRIDREINELRQLHALGQAMHAEQRVMMHAKIDEFFEAAEAKATAQIGAMIERSLAATPVH